MRFVPIKSEEQQAAKMLLSVRNLLIRQRTMVINAIRGHAAEFGVIGAKGPGKIAAVLERAVAGVPAIAREALIDLGKQLDALDDRLRAIEGRVLAWHKQNELSRRLATIPGIGPIGATSLVLTVPDPSVFRSARHFAAWIGLTPREHATAGRRRLGRISREGDPTLRRLLVVGAMAIVKVTKPGRGSAWLLGLLERRPRKLAAVALANKMARIAWAMMISGQAYRRPSAA
jgi:transposase